MSVFDLTEMVQPRKLDMGKPRLDLACTPGWVEVGRALTYGAAKYSPYNYRTGGGLEYSRLLAAALRHLTAFQCGTDPLGLDPESGLHHLAHAGASVQMLLDLVLLGRGVDDRWASEVKP